ncbi:MAG: hypothetical protein KGZ81_09750 [Flavobacteriales bacterium]|nr:hypothetical protein [Flavobacteriales bacterium]
MTEDKKHIGLTSLLPDRQRFVFNFFAHAQIFKMILCPAHLAHFVLPQPHKPTQKQNKKSQIANALFSYEANYLCKILPLLNDK